jgi:uncharacterized protein
MSIDWATMKETWGAALALFLIIEGVMPFLSPGTVRKTMENLSRMGNRQLRVMGLFSMVTGLALLYFMRR